MKAKADTGSGLFSYLERQCALYGKAGDCSLECFGFTAAPDGFSEYKTYRLCANDACMRDIISANDGTHALIERLSDFTSRGIRPFDISTRQANDGQLLHRVMFCTDRSGNAVSNELVAFLLAQLGLSRYEPLLAELAESLSFDPGRTPLVQLGAQFRPDGSVHAAKAYYHIERAEFDGNRRKSPSFDKISSIFSRMLQLDKNAGIPDLALAMNAINDHFVPHLIGINAENNACFFKLYFVAHDLSGEVKAVNYSRYSVDELEGFPTDCDRELFCSTLDRLGLYVKGMAVEPDTAGGIRTKFYLVEIPNRMS